MATEIIEKELSYRVTRCVFDVHNEVGPGVREECYQKAMEHRLHAEGIPFVAKPATRSDLIHHEIVCHTFEPDLVIGERIVGELKHQIEGFSRENLHQVMSYQKFWKLRLGFLINFGMDKAIIKRVPFDPPKFIIDEDYQFIRQKRSDRWRSVGLTARQAVLAIAKQFGAGYSEPVFRNLVLSELGRRGLTCQANVEVSPSFHDRRLPLSKITPILIDGLFCLQIEALQDEVSARAIRTMQTHLRLTGCEAGIVADFGKTKLTLRGVRA